MRYKEYTQLHIMIQYNINNNKRSIKISDQNVHIYTLYTINIIKLTHMYTYT